MKKMIFWLQQLLNSFAPLWTQKIKFWIKNKYYPDTIKPKHINEFILLEKLNSSSQDSIYVDKLKVKDFIQECKARYGLKNLFVPKTLCKSNNVDEFIQLIPDYDCFIKPNHGSGWIFKYEHVKHSEYRYSEEFKKMLQHWLDSDYSLISHEKCYEKIERYLFCEEVLKTLDDQLPDDVKVHCFHSVPSMVQMIRRTSGKLERETFDCNWKKQNWFKNEVLNIELDDKMKNDILEVSSKLSVPFKYVRLDFYLMDSKLYFSEITLYPASAALPLSSKDVDLYLGSLFAKLEKTS